jgi:hypothetical protein
MKSAATLFEQNEESQSSLKRREELFELFSSLQRREELFE